MPEIGRRGIPPTGRLTTAAPSEQRAWSTNVRTQFGVVTLVEQRIAIKVRARRTTPGAQVR